VINTPEEISVRTSAGITFDEIAKRAAERADAKEKAKAEKEQKRADMLKRAADMPMKDYIEARKTGEIK
jgi:hypothetical protein